MGQLSFDRRHSLPFAVAASIALNGAVLIFVGQTRWATTPELPEAGAVVVWLSKWLPPEAPRREDHPDDPNVAEELPASEAPQDPAPEEIPISEYVEPPPAVDSPKPSRSRLRADWEPIRPSIDWEEVQRRAVVRTREERAEADAYVTFSYPERPPRQTWDSGGNSTTIAGVRTRTKGPCVRSVTSFLTRLLLPVDICEWGTTGQDSYLTRDEQERLGAIRAEMEDNNLP